MYFDDHNPPHFHAQYGDDEMQVGIEPVTALEGGLPRRAASMVFEWTALHQRELLENWRRIQQAETPQRIAPLD